MLRGSSQCISKESNPPPQPQVLARAPTTAEQPGSSWRPSAYSADVIATPSGINLTCHGSQRRSKNDALEAPEARERRSRQSARKPERAHSPEEASLQKRLPGYRSTGTAVFSGASPHPCPWRSGKLLCGGTCWGERQGGDLQSLCLWQLFVHRQPHAQSPYRLVVRTQRDNPGSTPGEVVHGARSASKLWQEKIFLTRETTGSCGRKLFKSPGGPASAPCWRGASQCISRESNPGHIDGNHVFYH